LKKILQYLLILVIITLLFAVYGQESVEVDTTLAAPVDSAESVEPALFNEYLGEVADTTQVFLEFALSNEALGNYVGWGLVTRIRKQDVWRNSRGSVMSEYYDSEGVKINPATILRVNGGVPE